MLKVKIEAMRIAENEFSPFIINNEDIKKVLLIGDNGAGKSLLLKVLSLKQYQEFSIIKINDVAITCDSIAYISRLEFLEKYTPNQINKIMSMKYSDWDIHFYKLLLTSFEVDLNTPIHQLSLGKKQRIEIAVGLAKRPKLILIDEAFEGIDDVSRIQIMECIDSYLISNDACLIMATHSTFGLGENFDLIIHIHKGKVMLKQDIETFKQEMNRKTDYPTDQSIDTLLSIYKDSWIVEKGENDDYI